MSAQLPRSDRRFALAVAAAATVLALLGSHNLVRLEWNTPRDRAFLLSGDEPWYLMTARSLALDGDINVFNDFRDHGLLDFADRDHATLGYERFRALARGRAATHAYWHERRVLAVRPGMPLLLAPAYRAGLAWDKRIRMAAVWSLCVAAGALAGLTAHTASRAGLARGAAALAALAGAASAPLLFHASQIYTEIMAALLIMAVFLHLTGAPRAAPVWRHATAALALAYLPWLHDKYIPHLALLLTLWIVALRGAPRRVWVALGVPLALSFTLQGLYYHGIYGVPWPVSDHGGISLANGLRRGWAGLLGDATDGLWPWWPVLPTAAAGLLLGARRRPAVFGWALAMVAVHGLLTGLFPTWQDGPVPPLRYWTPVMPFWVLGVACALDPARPRWFRALTAGLLALAVAQAWCAFAHPRELFVNTHPWVAAHWVKGHHLWVRWPDLKPACGSLRQSLMILGAFATLVTGLAWAARDRAATATGQGASV